MAPRLMLDNVRLSEDDGSLAMENCPVTVFPQGEEHVVLEAYHGTEGIQLTDREAIVLARHIISTVADR